MAKAVRETGAEIEGQWLLRPEELDGEELAKYGRILDQRPASLRGWTVGMALAEQLLRVRTREGWTAPLKANAAQRGLRAAAGAAQYCAEGAADGVDDLGGGAVFS